MQSPTVNGASDQLLAHFQSLFDTQLAYFNSDATKSYEWRIDQLTRMEKMLSDHTQALEKAISDDFKTASSEQVFEVSATLATIAATKASLREWMTPIDSPVPKALKALGYQGRVFREPYGVTLIIGPFNGPLLLLLRPCVNAISGGNPCILKLSEELPATNAVLLEQIPKYFEPQSLTAVVGSRAEVTALLKLPFNFMFLTGSVNVGKVVMRAAAENLTPVLLELGGQNPAFVDPTANIKEAARKITWGAMAWGGSWCTSPGYAYVHESIADEFVAECRKSLIDQFGTDPKSNPDYSRIITPQTVKRFAGLIDPKLVVAGGKWDEEARYVDPTIMYPVTWDHHMMDDEIFGPLLPILTYKDIEEAYGEIKKRPRPLSAFFFSRDQKAIDHFLATLPFGGGAINEVNIHLFVETMPFGGVGHSGIGMYYGKTGFDSLTHAKSILICPPDVELTHLIPPFTPEKVEELAIWGEY
jgi:aldehyde dehydrogenase (NAD+)